MAAISRSRKTILLLLAALALAGPPKDAGAQTSGVANVEYDVTFDRKTAAASRIAVRMSFDVARAGPVVLSIPAWTPGSYEIDNFARFIRGIEATQDGASIRWDKTDFDSWRVHPAGPGRVTLAFQYLADTLDVGMAGSSDDMAYFNGTNVFPYPEGQGLGFFATVRVHTEPAWQIATGMRPAGPAGTYSADNYHDLVDMPFLIGRFDLDSLQVDGRWYRLATYPAGAIAGRQRHALREEIAAVLPPMAAVFGETPWTDYTIIALFDERFPGGAALEHQNSHLGIYTPLAIGSATLTSIIAHEIFHAWNVKRLRPEDLWPYRYDAAQPTTLLWVSEGITDYYADLALLRGGVSGSDRFYRATAAKARAVEEAGPVSLEDASLSTWIEPADGTAVIYYDKGSVAGLLLDILIRDASDNRGSLDAVLQELYRTEYQQGSGFTEEEFWGVVARVAEGQGFRDFRECCIDGRETYPWEQILPLAGLRLERDGSRRPVIDAPVEADSLGYRVTGVGPGSAAERSGIRAGDYVMAIDDIELTDAASIGEFFRRYADAPDGTVVTVRLRRADEVVTVRTELGFATDFSYRIVEDDEASAAAVRVRNGILEGVTAR